MAGGSSGGSSSGGPKKVRIEIIPLIDVVFFLLATFVLFTISLNKSNGPRVRLPEARTNEPRDPAGTVTVVPGLSVRKMRKFDPLDTKAFAIGIWVLTARLATLKPLGVPMKVAAPLVRLTL